MEQLNCLGTLCTFDGISNSVKEKLARARALSHMHILFVHKLNSLMAAVFSLNSHQRKSHIFSRLEAFLHYTINTVYKRHPDGKR